MEEASGRRFQYFATVGRGLDAFARHEIESARAAGEAGDVLDVQPLSEHSVALEKSSGSDGETEEGEGEAEGKLYFSTGMPIDGTPDLRETRRQPASSAEL